jgi:hypothetical protein
MRIMESVALTFLATFVFAFPPGQKAAVKPETESAEILERPLRHEIAGRSAPDVFQQLAVQESIPAGVVKARHHRIHGQEPAIEIPAGLTVRRALNELVRTDPTYMWSLSHGVLNLTPRGDRFPLLDFSVARFDSGRATTISDACTRAFQLPDVRKQIQELHLDQEPISFGPSLLAKDSTASRSAQKVIAVRVANTSLRNILNAVVSSAGRGVWVYEEHDRQTHHTYRLDFIDPGAPSDEPL